MEAFGKFIAATGLPHELVFVGRLDSSHRDGADYGEKLREIAARHGVNDRLRFTGPVAAEDLRAFYRMADVYVQPSFYETFGKTVAEAFFCGCPVIGANTSATPEIVGDAGLLFDPNNADELASCLRRMMTEPGLRETLARKGRERARLFTVDREIEGFIRVLHAAGGHAET